MTEKDSDNSPLLPRKSGMRQKQGRMQKKGIKATPVFAKLVVFLLIFQNTANVLLMRYTQMPGQEKYISTTAVVMSEIVKVMTCVIVIFLTEKDPLVQMYDEIVKKWRMTLLVGVPAFIYTIQNNLLFMALKELDAPVFQVLYQTKVLSTAMFAVAILRQKLTGKQWLTLVSLALGVAIVQLSKGSGGDDGDTNGSAKGISTRGVFYVLTAATMSGFAGVWFEKMLKQAGKVSLWMRNVQLGGFSIFLALLGVYTQDGEAVRANGFFQGYNLMVVATILCTSAGGLLVAGVMKYADNIVKGFATSIGVVLSTAVCITLPSFHYQPNFYMLIGSVIVLASAYFYNAFGKKR
eukprot:g235.t1